MKAVWQKVVACREDLDIEYWLVLVLTFHFAQVRCFPVDQEVLQQVLTLAASDLDLEVAAAGGPATVVRGPARGSGTRVGIGHHGVERQGSAGWWSGRPPRWWR